MDDQDETGIIFDFSRREEVDRWRAIGDPVMGGRSESRIRHQGASMVFEGRISFEQGGGFASIRSEPAAHDLGGTGGVALTCGGDGRSYRFSVRCDDSFDGIAYQAPFKTTAGELRTICICWREMQPTYHGRQIEGHPPLKPDTIRSFGFLIGERQEGPFLLGIYRLEAIGEGEHMPGTSGEEGEG